MVADCPAPADRIHRRLAAIDPRLATAPPLHPFAAYTRRGPRALSELLATAESHEVARTLRVKALEAAARILRGRRAADDVPRRLLRLRADRGTPRALRAAATKALVASGEPRLMAWLERCLVNDNPKLVAAAAHAMGIARYEAALCPLLEVLEEAHTTEVQEQAAWALGELGDSRAEAGLLAALRRGVVSVAVIEALGKVGQAHTVQVLLGCLAAGEAAQRLAAADAIATVAERHGEVRQRRVRAHLFVALGREREAVVAAALLTALAACDAPISEAMLQHQLRMGPLRPTEPGLQHSLTERVAWVVRWITGRAPASSSRG